MTLFTVVIYITALLLKGEAMFIHGTQLKQVFHTHRTWCGAIGRAGLGL